MPHVPPHPGASTAGASDRMRVHPRRDTTPELAVRRLLHAAGLRFRVAYPAPGIPRRSIDIAFTRYRVAVFVDGCFWHACPEHGTQPSANSAWWRTKLEANVARDADTTSRLEEQGWAVVRAWEHEPPAEVAGRVLRAVTERAGGGEPRGEGQRAPATARPPEA